jgi:hypothetical protein
MYKYSFLYVAVSVIVMLFLIQFSALKDYMMAQEPLSNQSQIVVAQTPVEKANLERLINLIFKHGITEIGHSLESYMHPMY